MKLIIEDKEQKQLFVAIFELLKGTSSIINLNFKQDELYIQGMDRSHVCLFDISIKKEWFSLYEIKETDTQRVCIHTQTVHSILSSANDTHIFTIYSSEDDASSDHLFIDLIAEEESNKSSKKEFSRFYKIPLMDDDYTYLEVPQTDYAVEFTLPAKKINEIVAKMGLFGESLEFQCNEERIDLLSSGVSGEMKVTIPLDDITECSITEGEEINGTFHLGFLQKICLSTKLSEEIQFAMSEGQPMKILYPLQKNSYVTFFMAPKAVD
jgi:proliferating cell nuclear antigen PCNA